VNLGRSHAFLAEWGRPPSLQKSEDASRLNASDCRAIWMSIPSDLVDLGVVACLSRLSSPIWVDNHLSRCDYMQVDEFAGIPGQF